MSPRQPTRLLVLRHGQSEWNALGRWQGHADIALSEAGRVQAADAGARIATLGTFTAVWASDLQRAFETAEIIARAMGIAHVQSDARLRENDVGEWEGLTQPEVEHGWPGYLAERRRPARFETYESAAARFIAALTDIAAQHPSTDVVVVSHGGVMRAARRSLGGVDHHLPNLSGSWFTVESGDVAVGDLVDPPSGDDSMATATRREVL